MLKDYQENAVKRMKNGCILCGGVGSGKSRTALAYYYYEMGGTCLDPYEPMDDISILDLYIITTARKRDSLDWNEEMVPFFITTDYEHRLYSHHVVVDSWNNIQKYKEIKNSFFIFDEDRVVGNGAWVKAFLKIAKTNRWILLSATPGDKWEDYIPVFIANGFYKTRTEFVNEHIRYNPYITKYPKIDSYVNVRKLERLRDSILVEMDFKRETVAHHKDIWCNYDRNVYRSIMRNRWNIWEDKPLENGSQLCHALRKVVNSDESRMISVLEIFESHPRIIVFYNFDYELDILKNAYYGNGVALAEWNGHKHQPVPETNRWVYLVQYTAGAEAWNCITTDTIIFYSQHYSYKIMVQAMGRIDRMNTPYTELYYYHLKSHSQIDLAISEALKEKKIFNAKKWMEKCSS